MPAPITPGQQLIDGSLINQMLAQLFATLSGIVATAGGGQANAVPLTGFINRVTSCVTNADSVKLPAAVVNPANGLSFLVVINAGAATLAVFPSSGQSINALAADASFSLATNKTAIFFCGANGVWNSNLTA